MAQAAALDDLQALFVDEVLALKFTLQHLQQLAGGAGRRLWNFAQNYVGETFVALLEPLQPGMRLSGNRYGRHARER